MIKTFKNPLLPAPHPDPWVIFQAPWYWYCGSRDNRIYLLRAKGLQDLAQADPIWVWTAPSEGMNSQHLWAPELHHLDGRWLIYYAADDGLNLNHRMYALESGSPLGPYVDRGRVATADDHWAIDGTVLSHPHGTRYFIWSGWEGRQNVKQNLYIAPLDGHCPWRITAPRVMISTPDQPWEQHGRPWVNEGPEVVVRDETLYLFYSASGSWTEDYCIGLLRCFVRDPVLDPRSWQKHSAPVFAKHPEARVFGVGHASLVQDHRRQWWIVYHAMEDRMAGWAGRSVRIQPFEWPDHALPQLGRPRPLEEPLAMTVEKSFE